MKSFLKFVIIGSMGDSMDFLITLDQFEGPLDLMLHLIKENKLDLFDLDMNVLATQYIDYIHAMQNLHLEVASEYLSELASLIAYKSKKLLPRETVEVEEEYEEDQRDQLVARLLEYQRYKEVSLALKEDYEQRQLHFSRPVSSLVEEWKVPVESDT
jgi:segregation and condensation protein A